MISTSTSGGDATGFDALEAALGTSPSAATRAADSILISPENVKRRRTAPAEEPCDDCAVDAKPSVT